MTKVQKLIVPSSDYPLSTIKVFSNEKIQILERIISQFNHSSAISISKMVKSNITHLFIIFNTDTWIINSEVNKHLINSLKNS